MRASPPEYPDPFNSVAPRIVIVGSSASGKTTLARKLAERLDIPHVELDALHWGPDWTSVPVEQFRTAAAGALSGEAWVADGNYSAVRDLVWGRASLLVWLDYGLPLIMRRLIRRTASRLWWREELWNGNRESLREHFTRDGLVYWVLSTYGKRRREYPQLFEQAEYAHLTVYRMTAPADTEAWLERIAPREALTGKEARP